MKKSILLVLLFFALNNAYSQFGARYEEVELTLKDGTVLKGYGNVGYFKISYKDINKKNAKKYKYSEVLSAKFTLYDKKTKAFLKEFTVVSIDLREVETSEHQWTLGELIYNTDKIKIYGVHSFEGGGTTMGAGLGGQVAVTNIKMGFNSFSYDNYYCFIGTETKPRIIYEVFHFFKPFALRASQCFKECPELSEKIKNKEFTIEDIITIGEFYDKNCN